MFAAGARILFTVVWTAKAADYFRKREQADEPFVRRSCNVWLRSIRSHGSRRGREWEHSGTRPFGRFGPFRPYSRDLSSGINLHTYEETIRKN